MYKVFISMGRWLAAGICCLVAVMWVRSEFSSDMLAYVAPRWQVSAISQEGLLILFRGRRIGVQQPYPLSDQGWSLDIGYRGISNYCLVRRNPGATLSQRAGLFLPRNFGTTADCVLPCWLVWLLTAGLAAAAWFGPPLLRGHRRREGLCAECGYDLRASSGRCPECGAAFKPADIPNAADRTEEGR